MRSHSVDASAVEQAQAGRIWRELGGQYGPHLPCGLMNFGAIFKNPGDLTRAAQAYREALELNRSSFGREHRRTAAALNRLAETLAMAGNSAEARRLLDEALDIERAIAPDSFEMAETLNNLAVLDTYGHRWSEAEPLLQQASHIIGGLQPDDSIETVILLASSAALHTIRSREQRAESLLRRALAVCDRTLAPNDPRLGILLSQEGMLLLNQNKVALALADLTRAAGILRTSKGGNSREFAIAETNLGRARMAQGRLDDAEILLRHAIEVHRAGNARTQPDVASALLRLGECRVKQRRYQEAISCLRESAATFEFALGRSHPDTTQANAAYESAARVWKGFSGKRVTITESSASEGSGTHAARQRVTVSLTNR